MSGESITVIGGGLAGTEAAWQIARAGIPVTLYEMRPVTQTPAHHSGDLAELVCSNSFGAESLDRASGLLHEELRRLGSIVIQVADKNRVPAGGALAVDRVMFSKELTETIASHPLITLKREEVKTIPSNGVVVLATGPLTANTLARELQKFTGMEYLNFFDAASPIILGESINKDIAFLASRYGRGEAAYLNCPMDREQYLLFWRELCNAQQAELKDFERENATFFEACLPIEELARRGEDTMRFGPLKPVGLVDPRFPNKKYYAVVQLRPEDKEGQLWNMVGFQTNLRWGEQKRVFRLIPGLENAEFVRFGVMHKNIFLNAPKLLLPTLQFKRRHTLFACGQLVGTEGYTAAVAGGWLAGTNAARIMRSLPPLVFPKTTMLGALIDYITTADSRHFQPMPPNFGILPPLDTKIRSKPQRYRAYAHRALSHLEDFISAHGLPLTPPSRVAINP